MASIPIVTLVVYCLIQGSYDWEYEPVLPTYNLAGAMFAFFG